MIELTYISKQTGRRVTCYYKGYCYKMANKTARYLAAVGHKKVEVTPVNESESNSFGEFMNTDFTKR